VEGAAGERQNISLLKNISQSLESLAQPRVGGGSVLGLGRNNSMLREGRCDNQGKGAVTEMRKGDNDSKLLLYRDNQNQVRRQNGEMNHEEQAPQGSPEAAHTHQKRMFMDRSVTQIAGSSTTGLLELAANQSKSDLEESNPLVRMGLRPESKHSLTEQLPEGGAPGTKEAADSIQIPGKLIPSKRWKPY